MRSRRTRTHLDQRDSSEPVAETVSTHDDTVAPTLLLRVEEAALRLGIGRTSMYRLVMSGEVESVQIGGLRRIPAPCLTEYIDRLRHLEEDPGA